MTVNGSGRVEPGEARVEESLDRIVEEGEPRLHRGWLALSATGALGGFDVATGVLALLAVLAATHNHLLAGVAFSIGLIALLLGHSELFTEGFLIPVTTVAAGKARVVDLVRMWFVVLVANLVGGWIITWLIMKAFPSLGSQAIEGGRHFVDLGINLESFCLAVLGGSTITLMTRMQHGTESMPARIVAAVAAGFLLAGLQLNHSILDSLLIFAGLHTGHAPYGYLDWLTWVGWAILGNIVGGIGLVTLLRLVRSRRLIQEKRAEEAAATEEAVG
ncbi:formate/nitrite transporter family protein [Planosporangium thailandense]|uniref:Formate/nitrite transporter family protein n=1 Tax=Planosporangium thailandense TaxID=765197 RepID=A0ABX0XW07_9ACTN|nr:formate/nitrite transporter family protein [Planosporangium thailandense]NJC70232.1 formate/nitrite transporter family protein [Planosporangium thailandense]